MFIRLVVTVLCTIQMLTQQSQSLKYLDIKLTDIITNPAKAKVEPKAPVRVNYESYTPKTLVHDKPIRRYNWKLSSYTKATWAAPPRVYEDEKDSNIKYKIMTLIEQSMDDSRRKMRLTDTLKEEHREKAAYRAGFILAMVKKSKEVLDELFNVAIKHKDEWMALEHLKIFELIVHTNVDTTNLLRQLVDVHVKQMNATQDKKRVILI